jgi:DnaJ-class molecular chaperone
MDPAFKQEVTALAKALEEMDYYQILMIGQKAFTQEIKKAYFDQSRKFHPDKYYNEEPELVENITRIFKRINEAYKALSDQEIRVAYTKGINGPNRQKLLRYDPRKAQQEKSGGPEDEGKTPMGKKYYQLAKTSLQNKDYKSARINLQLAAKMEPGNQTFKKRLAEVEDLLSTAKKRKKGQQ